MFVFKHPKYYTELRKRNKSDQAISSGDVITGDSTESQGVRPGPGPKHQASSNKLKEPQATSDKHQAPSNKPQAPSSEKKRPQASSPKQQASSSKPQATSSEI